MPLRATRRRRVPRDGVRCDALRPDAFEDHDSRDRSRRIFTSTEFADFASFLGTFAGGGLAPSVLLGLQGMLALLNFH